MPASIEEVEVGILEEYSDEVAAQLGRLTLFLSDNATGEPVPERILRTNIENSLREQLIATLHGRIVGAATLNIVGGIMPKEKVWLEDFVTDEGIRRQGVARKLWERIEQWCQEHGLEKMDHTSGYNKTAAHAFYEAMGSQIRHETAPFRTLFTRKDEVEV